MVLLITIKGQSCVWCPNDFILNTIFIKFSYYDNTFQNGWGSTMRRFIICTYPQTSSRIMMWAGHVARMGEEKKYCKIFGEKPRRKKATG
jgi:hypothetical protein